MNERVQSQKWKVCETSYSARSTSCSTSNSFLIICRESLRFNHRVCQKRLSLTATRKLTQKQSNCSQYSRYKKREDDLNEKKSKCCLQCRCCTHEKSLFDFSYLLRRLTFDSFVFFIDVLLAEYNAVSSKYIALRDMIQISWMNVIEKINSFFFSLDHVRWTWLRRRQRLDHFLSFVSETKIECSCSVIIKLSNERSFCRLSEKNVWEKSTFE